MQISCMLLQTVRCNDRACGTRALRKRQLRPRVALDSTNDMPPTSPSESQRAGLCASCRHAELVTSSRGATFYRCGLSDRDPRFPRYPSLPVLVCRGYEARSSV